MQKACVVAATFVCLLAGCDRTRRQQIPPTPVPADTTSTPTTTARPLANERASDDGPIQPADALRPDDQAVLDAALSHFAADPRMLPSFKNRRRLVVHRQTTGGSAYVRAHQVSADSATNRLPDDALADLEARNNGPPVTVSGMTFTSVRRAPAPLDALRRRSHHVVLADLSRFTSGGRFGFSDAFHEAHPDAKAYAWASLPGYSADGRRAVVRIDFGPTAHGATATYLLEKHPAAGWKVVWRKRAYYA